MDVSIIIVNYNTFELTCNCIRSVLAKTAGCTFEIIVVDNNSSERNPSAFLELFPDIRLVRNRMNVGFARGNNSGIEVAVGEFILLLNSDTELINNAILYCLTSMRSNERTSAVGCKLMFAGGDVQHNCQRFPSLRYKTFELFRIQKFIPPSLGGKILLGSFFDHNSAVYPDWIWGTFFMFRKSLLTLLPGQKLADEFFMYVEDMQWCMDFRNLGYSIFFEPRAKVIHHMGKSGADRDAAIKCNTEIFMKANYSPLKIALLKRFDKWLRK